jgi:hypothetical protein
MMELLLEKVALAYREGEPVTLDVGEREGYVVIDLTIAGDATDTRTCLLEPVAAAAFVQALQEAIARAKVKRES